MQASTRRKPSAGSCLLPALVLAAVPRACRGLQTQGPLENEWFGTFSEGESSSEQDVDELRLRHKGWEKNRDDPAASAKGEQAQWYHESPSGGEKEAWQSHFPSVDATGAWHVNSGGAWQEDYQHAAIPGPEPKKPEWFDTAVDQLDSFGRARLPDVDSPKRLLSWMERSVNTTLTCDTVGCTAFSMLQAFDASTEKARHCKMSLFLHPTDFDDLYSGERLLWIRVNDHVVNMDCFPMISGCNQTTQAPLYPCVQDLPLESLLDNTGALHISAKISNTVDECPFEGHLLAAVPMVTCQVTPKAPLLNGAPGSPAYPVVPIPTGIEQLFPTRASAPLRCTARGCVAVASLRPDKKMTEVLRSVTTQCLLNVSLYQTDYDGEEGTPELIEYVNVSGVPAVGHVAPGKNPCRSAWAGTPLSSKELGFSLLSGLDVTKAFGDGNLFVEAKITPYVDECAHNGYLLDGVVDLQCTLLSLRPPPAQRTKAAPAVPLEPEPLSQGPLEPTPLPTPTFEPLPVPALPPAAPTHAPAPSTTTTVPEQAAKKAPEASPEPEPAPAPGPFLNTAPFGREDVGLQLEEFSEMSQDILVDAVESAQVAEIKRAVFRALTKLRAAQIKEFDTIARIESQSLDEYNDDHHFRRENPLEYLHSNEPSVSTDRFTSFHKQ